MTTTSLNPQEDSVKPQSRAEAKALGAVCYYTGKPCKHGHVAERLTSSGACLECDRIAKPAKARRHYEKHGERIRQRVKAYRAANSEKKRASDRRWREANLENVKKKRAANYQSNRKKSDEQVKAWIERNYEQHRQYQREYQRAYRSDRYEKALEQKRAWRDNNREITRQYVRNRRALRRAAIGIHTAKDIAHILRQQRRRCAWCAARLGKKYEVDHIVPLSRGGSNERRNLQVLCRPCNRSKHAKDPIQFAREHGRLL